MVPAVGRFEPPGDEERKAVLLEVPHVAAWLLGVDERDRWSRLHRVVELGEQQLRPGGRDRAERVRPYLSLESPPDNWVKTFAASTGACLRIAASVFEFGVEPALPRATRSGSERRERPRSPDPAYAP